MPWDHEHERKAAAVATYPPELCRAIVRGLKRHLRCKKRSAWRKSLRICPPLSPPRSKEVDLDDFEDLLPEEVQQFREEMQEKKRAAVALTAEDTQKVCKMH